MKAAGKVPLSLLHSPPSAVRPRRLVRERRVEGVLTAKAVEAGNSAISALSLAWGMTTLASMVIWTALASITPFASLKPVESEVMAAILVSSTAETAEEQLAWSAVVREASHAVDPTSPTEVTRTSAAGG